MKYTQFFIMEATTKCNFAARHPECPVSDPRRFASLSTARALDEDSMVDFGVRAYREFGFRGFIGYHYYCEPTLVPGLITAVSSRIRDQVPAARFVLWTNGSRITKQSRQLLNTFQHVFVTNYQKRQFRFLRHRSGIHVFPPSLDSRRTATQPGSSTPCLRPFTEFIIDHFGNVHLCCMDWQGLSAIGNVFTHGMEAVIDRFQAARAALLQSACAEGSPAFCRTCWARFSTLDSFDDTIKHAAQRYVLKAGGTVAARQHKRGAPPKEGKVYAAITKKGWTPRQPATASEPYKESGQFKLFGVITSWNEDDIIEAAVRNLGAQGCDRVLLVDNASVDDTVAVAKSAGAEIGEIYETDYYVDSIRITKVNDLIRRETEASREDIWWLVVDADEFPSGARGGTVREIIRDVGGTCNVLGFDAFDHYPTDRVANVPGRHPADYQPYGMVRWSNACQSGHWKHSAFLLKGGAYTAGMFRGFHNQVCGRRHPPLLEPDQTLILHHFMYRQEEKTRWRLAMLCKTDKCDRRRRSAPDDKFIGGEGAIKRFRSLDAVYSGKWSEVQLPHSQAYEDVVGVDLQPWRFVLEPYSPHIARWYPSGVAPMIPPKRMHVPPPVAVCMVAYRIPNARVAQHFAWNDREYRKLNAKVLLCVESPYSGLPEYVSQFVYPHHMKLFSLARTRNHVVRRACDAEPRAVVVACDIDIAWDRQLEWIVRGAAGGRAVIPLCCTADRFEDVGTEDAPVAVRAEGTVGMSAPMWHAVCGYDERRVGYGREDGDLVDRLFERGLPVWRYHRIWHIAHDGKWNRGFNPPTIGPDKKMNYKERPRRWFSKNWGLRS